MNAIFARICGRTLRMIG